MMLRSADLQIDVSRQPREALSYEPKLQGLGLGKAASWLKGESVNETENRPAMHPALRASKNGSFPSSFTDLVLKERERQKAFVESCQAKTILHIGIGGSEFGPRVAYEFLQVSHEAQKEVRFLSTLTPDSIKTALEGLNPKETLVFLASKSFTTDETSYLLQVLIDAFSWPKEQIIVATASPDKAIAAGFTEAHIFPFWDWVGGRYSIWSSVGLSVALAFGWTVFEAFLAGGEAADRDLNTIEDSAAFKLARIFQANRVSGRPALAVLPYHDGLRSLPAYLQQLIMESNGKPSGDPAAPIVFGAPGTNFQHSFGQFLHQGPDLCLPIFIDVKASHREDWAQKAQARLHANARAQADMLWEGCSAAEAHKKLPGKRPSVFITLPDASPRSLGSLLALFEHVTVLDGFLSGVNPFDQWGVEAAKNKARDLLGS